MFQKNIKSRKDVLAQKELMDNFKRYLGNEVIISLEIFR